MIKEKKSLKVSRSPSRRKFFKTAAATGVAAVAASSLSAPAVAKERIEASMVATWPRDFPGLGTGAQRLAQRLSDMSDGRIQVTYYAALKGLKSTGSADFNKVWSYLGTPCISLPLLQGENNLPLGIQVIGEKYDDNRFLGVSSWLEKESEKFNE